MGHEETYHQNEAYATFLDGWDVSFFAKYIDTLTDHAQGGPVLDVGCGVGQVVEALNQSGVHALGVDISHPNIERALARGVTCQCYDGKRLPFEDGHFTAVGAFNVLEHVDDPSGFLDELVRVTRPGGMVVVSSPNFFRCIGFRDYHPRMRGWCNKWRNFLRLMQKRRQLKGPRSGWCFDEMKPIEREPFSPDDDAVVATNPMEISAFLEHTGCTIVSIACTDRPVAKWLDLCLNAGPWKYGMLNGFVVARKRQAS